MSFENGFCSQCGKRFIESACGPTHLALLMERDSIASAAIANGYAVENGAVTMTCCLQPKMVMGIGCSAKGGRVIKICSSCGRESDTGRVPASAGKGECER